jgi:hypothetical protein
MLAKFSTHSRKISSFLVLAFSILSKAYFIAMDDYYFATVDADSETGINAINSCLVFVSISSSDF